MRIHALLPDEALATLRSGPDGLSGAEAERRLGEFGPNDVEDHRGPPLHHRIFKQVTHFLALLLWVAAALAAGAELWQGGQGMGILALAIVGVIVINASFSLWQEYRSERALEVLQKLLPRQARVVRDGQVVEVPTDLLVPGDVILVAGGDAIPADCRILHAMGLQANIAAMTGESASVPRDAQPSAEHEIAAAANVLLAGTSVTVGEARAVVFATGARTLFGEIARLTQAQRPPPTPLQREVAHLSRLVAVLATGLGVVFFLAGRIIGMPLWDSLLFAIGIIVANVPEGLLPTVTLSLAMAAQRLARRRMLVRHLSAVEALGSVSVICTDKTGTLTENRMVPARVALGDRMAGDEALGALPQIAPDMADALSHCHSLRRMQNGAAGSRTLNGDPLEVALLGLAGGELGARPLLHELPFDAARRRMSTLHQDDGGVVLYTKGALDTVLPLCGGLDRAAQDRIKGLEADMANAGLRVLACAFRRWGGPWTPETLEQDLVFLGLIGLEDPVRPEVPDAIARSRDAGIRSIMITGDHPLTALAVARRIGMVGHDAHVLSGDQVQRMSEIQLQLVLDHHGIIFARTRVDQKRRIVAALQKKGEFVAVTGDGVNDAPALRQADVGIAMGRGGTDVAREAADMIMVDDNFATIVAAVEEGRAVFDNIRKFLGYILTSNIPQIVPFLGFVLFGVPLALTIIQILAIDLGSDMVPALALAAEKPAADVMQRLPRRRNQRLLDWPLMVRAYLVRGPMQALAGMSAFHFVTGRDGSYAEATAACLAAIIAMQVVNLFLSRSDRSLVFFRRLPGNRLLVWGLLAEGAIAAFILYTTAGNLLFQTAPVPLEVWLFILPFAIPLIVADEAWKWVMGRKGRP